MIMNRITLVTLAVADVAAAANFYQLLGWQAETVMDDVAFFDMNGMKFGLYDRGKMASDLNRNADTLGTGAMTLAQNFSSEPEVDAAFARVIAVGGQACKPPEKVFWGGYSGTWADPDGHVWEYAYNPFWALDGEGRLA